MPSIRSWQSLNASEKQRPWIGRTSLNQHYDFRPKCGIKHPIVMAAPPKNSQMIWLHFLGRKCFVTHSSHERFSAPSEIQAQCYRIMKSMGSNVGQFLLCQTQKKWLCYDFNPLPNWQLCHKKYSFIAEQLVTILAPSYAFNSNKKTAFQGHTIPQTAAPTISNSTTQRPKKPPQPFIAKHLRPELAAAKYHIE